MNNDLALSVEEFAETEDKLRQESQNVQRVCDTIYALECLCETLESKEELSQEDVLLLKTADMFAATGTDAEPGQIVPSFEAHTPTNVAIEGILDNIQNGIASLAVSSKVVATLVESRMSGLKTVVMLFEKKQEELGELLVKNRGTTDIEIKIDYADNGDNIKTFDDYVKLLEKNSSDLERYLRTHNSRGITVQESIVRTYASFSNGKYSATMAKVFNMFNEELLGHTCKGWQETRQTKFITEKTSSEFYGSKELVLKTSNLSMSPVENRASVRQLIDNVGWSLNDSSKRVGDRVKKKVVFKVTPDQIQKLYDQNERLYEVLKKYHFQNGHFWKNIREAHSHMASFALAGAGLAVGVKTGNVVSRYAGILSAIAGQGSQNLATTIKSILGGAAGGLLFGVAAGAAYNTIRKLILAWIFSTMKLQYRITEYVGFVDSRVVGLLIEHMGHNYTVINRYVK